MDEFIAEVDSIVAMYDDFEVIVVGSGLRRWEVACEYRHGVQIGQFVCCVRRGSVWWVDHRVHRLPFWLRKSKIDWKTEGF